MAKLKIKAVSAKNLEKKDIGGLSDPYVLIWDSKKGPKSAVKTKVIIQNLNPVWNEEFTLEIDDPNTAVIEFKLKDYDKFKSHDDLGSGSVQLSFLELVQGIPRLMSFPLVGHKGEVQLEFTALDFGVKQDKKEEKNQ